MKLEREYEAEHTNVNELQSSDDEGKGVDGKRKMKKKRKGGYEPAGLYAPHGYFNNTFSGTSFETQMGGAQFQSADVENELTAQVRAWNIWTDTFEKKQSNKKIYI